MGGLVGRFALLQRGDDLPFVKRLIMLGTPNHGTLQTGSLGLLAHLTREATGTIWPLLSRKDGIKELSEVGKLANSVLNDTSENRTHHVDYVTVPALFYHEGTGFFRMKSRGTSRGLAALNLFFELTKKMPFWTIELQKPQDGIVEESSVYLGAKVATRFSERSQSCNGVPNAGGYVHVIHKDHLDADHVTIQQTVRSATILAEILLSPPISVWRSQTQTKSGYHFTPIHPCGEKR